MSIEDETEGATLTTTWPELQKMANEFFQALPHASQEEVDAGFKCLSLGYLGMEGSAQEQHQARLLLDIASRKVDEHAAGLVPAVNSSPEP